MLVKKINFFGSNLKFFRRQTGLTQEQIAEKIGMSYSYYSRLESGHSAPSLDALMKITSTLDIPLDFLLKDDGCRAYQIYATSKFIRELSNMDDDALKYYADTLFQIYRHIKERDIDIE